MELTGWAGADDGLLAWDRDGNGRIDSGRELFGNNTELASGLAAQDGFAALGDLDENSDGVVDSSDTNWGSLRVLRRAATDAEGTGGSMELVSLSSLGIVSLGVRARSSDHVDELGNEHRLAGSYTKTDGTTGDMSDVWFQVNHGVTIYSGAEIPEHGEAISALPDLSGAGRAYDLRDAMALDEAGLLRAPYYSSLRSEARSLRALVEAFRDESDAAARHALAEKILLRWTGAEGAAGEDYRSGLSSLTHTTAQKFAVVEAFMGHQWREGQGNREPARSTAEIIEGLYQESYDYLWTGLMFQTHFLPMLSAIKVLTDEESGEKTVDFSGLAELEDVDPSLHPEFLRAFIHMGEEAWLVGRIRDTAPSLGQHYNAYAIDEAKGLLVRGTVENDVLDGADGATDQFDGDAGGGDRLRGRGGDDVYWLGRGTGYDVVDEAYGNPSAGDAGDAIRLKPGLVASDVRLSRDTDSLYVSLVAADGAVADRLEVRSHYRWSDARIERVELADGTEVFGAEDFALARLHGGADDDTLDGHAGVADHFDGDAGGDDRLRGRGGDDVYWLGRGTGYDVVDEGYYNSKTGDANDRIAVEQGYGIDDVELVREGNCLTVRLLGEDGAAEGSLKIQDHYSRAAARVERIEVGSRSFDTSQAEDYMSALADFRDEDIESKYATLQAVTDDYWA